MTVKKASTLMFLPTWSERPLLLRETNSVDMTSKGCYLQTETTCKTTVKSKKNKTATKQGQRHPKPSHLSAKGQELEKLEVNRRNLHSSFARKQHKIKNQRHPCPSLCWNSHQTVSSVVPKELSPISEAVKEYLPKCSRMHSTCGNTQTPTRSLSLN